MRLPLWGGSGLKYGLYIELKSLKGSPSLGREWIEIPFTLPPTVLTLVSLFGEGVD